MMEGLRKEALRIFDALAQGKKEEALAYLRKISSPAGTQESADNQQQPASSRQEYLQG